MEKDTANQSEAKEGEHMEEEVEERTPMQEDTSRQEEKEEINQEKAKACKDSALPAEARDIPRDSVRNEDGKEIRQEKKQQVSKARATFVESLDAVPATAGLQERAKGPTE